jgi:hypothetical protein
MNTAGITVGLKVRKVEPYVQLELSGQVVNVEQSEVAAADDGAEPVGSAELGVEVLSVCEIVALACELLTGAQISPLTARPARMSGACTHAKPTGAAQCPAIRNTA